MPTMSSTSRTAASSSKAHTQTCSRVAALWRSCRASQVATYKRKHWKQGRRRTRMRARLRWRRRSPRATRSPRRSPQHSCKPRNVPRAHSAGRVSPMLAASSHELTRLDAVHWAFLKAGDGYVTGPLLFLTILLMQGSQSMSSTLPESHAGADSARSRCSVRLDMVAARPLEPRRRLLRESPDPR